MYSATQLQTYMRCFRLWYLIYQLRSERPKKDVFELGRRCHKIAEEWLLLGRPPNLSETWISEKGVIFYPGRIMAAGLSYLPPPKTDGLEIEKKFEFIYKGITFFGYIDFSFVSLLNVRHVGDHKTIASLSYMPSKKAFEDDIQRALYAYAKLEDRKGVMCDWVYYQKRGFPQAQKLSLWAPREKVIEKMDKIHAVAKQIEDFKRDPEGFLKRMR